MSHPILKQLRGDVPSKRITKIPRTEQAVRDILNESEQVWKETLEARLAHIRKLCRE